MKAWISGLELVILMLLVIICVLKFLVIYITFYRNTVLSQKCSLMNLFPYPKTIGKTLQTEFSIPENTPHPKGCRKTPKKILPQPLLLQRRGARQCIYLILQRAVRPPPLQKGDWGGFSSGHFSFTTPSKGWGDVRSVCLDWSTPPKTLDNDCLSAVYFYQRFILLGEPQY